MYTVASRRSHFKKKIESKRVNERFCEIQMFGKVFMFVIWQKKITTITKSIRMMTLKRS